MNEFMKNGRTILALLRDLELDAMEAIAECTVRTVPVSENESIATILNKVKSEAFGCSTIVIEGPIRFLEYEGDDDLGGIEIYKHIRLTPHLASARLLPVVICADEGVVSLLRQRADNLLCCAPGCEVVKRTERRAIRDAVSTLQGFPDEAALRVSLGPFVAIPEAERRQWTHAHLNRVGVGRLVGDFASDVFPAAHPFLKATHEDLLLKKMDFVYSDLQPSNAEHLQEDYLSFREKVRRSACRFYYLDDQWHEGWASVLYAGLTGRMSDTPQVKEETWRPDPVFTAEASFDRAIRALDKRTAVFTEVLSLWSRQENHVEQCSTRFKEAQAKKQATELARNKKLQSVSAADDQLEKITSRHEFAVDSLNKAILAFNAIGFFEFKENASRPEQILTDLPTLQQDASILSGALREMQGSATQWETAYRETERLGAELSDANSLIEGATAVVAEANREMDSARAALLKTKAVIDELARPEMALVDLRLTDSDEEKPPDQFAGVSFLAQIKERFPYTPILVITASERAVSLQAALRAGADGYWIKGWDSGARLMDLVEHALQIAALSDLWVMLEKARARTRWYTVSYKSGSRLSVTLTSGDQDRQLMLELLDHSFALLRLSGKIRTALEVGSTFPWNQLALNLYLVQELRFKDINWGNMSHPPEEQQIRSARHRIAHTHVKSGGPQTAQERTEPTRDNMMRLFRYTLEQILMGLPS